MWKVPSERIALDLDGPTVEVERLISWTTQYEGLHTLARFMEASKPSDEYVALRSLWEQFIAEAQPSWDIVDNRGPVPATAAGMARLPLTLSIAICSMWLNSLVVEEVEEEEDRESVPGLRLVESKAPSAVDAVMPPGQGATTVKRRLRAAKRQARKVA